MSDVEDSHSDDRTNNEQYRRPMPDYQNNIQLTKRLKLDEPIHPLLIEDILHHLFSFFNIQDLVKMSRVCKVWQIVSRQKIKFASTASFGEPMERPAHKVYEYYPMDINLIKNVLEQTDKTVTHADICGSDEIKPDRKYYEVCQILSDNCPNLTKLCLSFINMSCAPLFYSNLGRCLPSNLRTLEIKCCSDLTDYDFGMILENCKNLEYLVIDWTIIKGLSIIEGLKSGQLKKLSLLDCDAIDKSYLFRILEMFKSSLRELELKSSVIDDYSLVSDSNNMLVDFKFSLLETFRLERHDDCRGSPRNLFYNLKWFLNAMPYLNTLKLNWCMFTANKECYFKLLPKCVPLLKELHIWYSLPRYRTDISFLSELKNLEILVLDGLFYMYQYEDVDSNYSDGDEFIESHILPDQAKEAILTHFVAVIIKCTKLKTVIFGELPMLNDDHIFTMISSMPSLKLLEVNTHTESRITGSFVSKCADLDRTCPIKVELNNSKIKRASFPAIPPFMELYNLS